MQPRLLLVLAAMLCIGLVQSQDEWVPLYKGFTEKEFKTADEFIDWVVTGAETSNYFFTCGRGNMILGGPYAFSKRTAVSRIFKLPAHYQVRVQVQLWKLKNWDNRRMIILVDGSQWETLWGYTDGKSICGGAAGNDAFFDVQFDVSHDQPALSVLFTSTLEGKAWNQSWGIKNINIQYKPCPGACAVCSGPDATKCQMWQPAYWSWFEISGPEGWSVANGKLEKNVCSGIPILGGFNNLGGKAEVTRIFQPLIPHYRLKVQFQFWKVDSWDNEQGQLFVDRKLSWYQNFQYSEGVELCGGSNDGYPEKVVNVNQEVPHTFNAVNLKLTSTLDEGADNESWGVRQFYLYVAKCANNCDECTGPNDGDCTACTPPYVIVNGACADTGAWILQTKDLNPNTFDSAKDWTVSGNANPAVVTSCGGTSLLGGYGVFAKDAAVKRTFSNLPAHKRIRVLAEVWKIDAWDGETIFINLDGRKVWEQAFGWNDPGSYDLCGNTDNIWPEKKQKVEIIIGHTQKDINFEISSTLKGDAKTQSWALRDFSIWYEKADQCATLFTECNYGGQSFTLCDQEANFQLKKLPANIKSVQVPPESTLVLFDESDYGGLKVSYTESQPCIPKLNFSLAQLNMESSPVLVAQSDTIDQ